MAYNTSVHSGTGYTLFELTFRHKANMPSATSLTSTLSKDELFRLWKNRHSEYLKHAKRITERNKLRYKRGQDRNTNSKFL